MHLCSLSCLHLRARATGCLRVRVWFAIRHTAPPQARLDRIAVVGWQPGDN
ncbi:hypothetical protein BZL30_1790 [Mycobacterium kansasii]|uniref:Uncharacterized protein n=1 Tax=Mycobacterium kansasii TaxID=1768 RepID=A0A1V3XK77_MYCKA|nr:hypothetical protein BZL30_1790 [Mycobacterium kansasii]